MKEIKLDYSDVSFKDNGKLKPAPRPPTGNDVFWEFRKYFKVSVDFLRKR